QVDELASKYAFTGREPLTVEQAVALLEELRTIDRLLEQLRDAMKNARIAIVDLDSLERFAPPEQVESLRDMARQVEELLRQLAESQGLERSADGWTLSPSALRTYQSKLLREIFNDLQAARSGRHDPVSSPDGAIESASTRPWEFGDSLASLDAIESITNSLIRRAAGSRDPARDDRAESLLRGDDLRVHRTRHSPRCATVVILDMSGSMRYGAQFVACKRMAIALDGLIRREYPGDALHFVEMYTLARAVRTADLPALMPKPVTISRSVVRLRADMSDPRIGELDLPLHFTNIQRALQVARQLLATQPTPNKQIVLLTDGLPTAHFEGSELLMLYPPDPRTERETMREAARCRNEGITLNLMLLPSWSQDEDDVGFAHRLAESTGGRVFFTGGRELDRFVVWDYVTRRRSIIG
ncbi:MAG: VWA domain-containing protein, partial [Phycisphaerae bacterium]|nr:VWA domain-containing protein [Phycisphaerae bacterium]